MCKKCGKKNAARQKSQAIQEAMMESAFAASGTTRLRYLGKKPRTEFRGTMTRKRYVFGSIPKFQFANVDNQDLPYLLEANKRHLIFEIIQLQPVVEKVERIIPEKRVIKEVKSPTKEKIVFVTENNEVVPQEEISPEFLQAESEKEEEVAEKPVKTSKKKSEK